MLDFNLGAPPVTHVVKGVEGKMMLIHSDSVKCGKTTVGSQMPKPFYLRFEQGANAIEGLPYAPLTSWADFKKVNKKLCSDKPIQVVDEKGKEKDVLPTELYTTLIIDTFDVAIRWCKDYVTTMYGVRRIKEGNDGFGLWDEYATEWFKEMNKLMNAGYFIYGISHSEPKTIVDGVTSEEYTQMRPKGDKRTIDLIIEAVDFLGYVKSNGVDENGEVVKSSIYFAETKEYLAGTRFTYMPREIKEFSAENIQKAVKHAVEMKEKEDGVKAVNFDSKKKSEEKERVSMSYEELLDKIKPLIAKLWAYEDSRNDIVDVIENYLGTGAQVSQATKKQVPQLELILSDLTDMCKEKGVEV